MLHILIGIVIGVILSVIFISIFHKTLFKKEKEEIVGTLRVDRSDPDDGPYLFLELSTDPREIMKKETVKFNVNTESYIPQK